MVFCPPRRATVVPLRVVVNVASGSRAVGQMRALIGVDARCAGRRGRVRDVRNVEVVVFKSITSTFRRRRWVIATVLFVEELPALSALQGIERGPGRTLAHDV